jgi:hypothetical protein
MTWPILTVRMVPTFFLNFTTYICAVIARYSSCLYKEQPKDNVEQDDTCATSPSSTTTPRKMNATLFPSDDDLFAIKPLSYQPRRQRPSHLQRWIEDQRTSPLLTDKSSILELSDDDASSIVGTASNPYLAYPQLSRVSSTRTRRNDVNSIDSYDVVEDVNLPRPEQSPTPTRRDASEVGVAFIYPKLTFFINTASRSSRYPCLVNRLPLPMTGDLTRVYAPPPCVASTYLSAPTPLPLQSPMPTLRHVRSALPE